MSAQAKAWATAIAVVGGSIAVGALLGRYAGSPVVGGAIGLVGGMALNRKRRCPVCMAHHARIQSLMTEEPS